MTKSPIPVRPRPAPRELAEPDAPTERPRTERRLARWLVALALGLAALVHAPALGNGYAGDDRWIAMPTFDDGRENAAVHDLAFAVGKPYWAAVESDPDPLWRPLTSLSHALAARLAGGAAWPGHAFNLLLHGLATALVVLLVRRAGGGAVPAGVAGVVFAVHALHSEAVAQLVGRAELLAFGCGAGALVLAARRGGLRLLAAALLLFLAACSKESGVVFAVLLLPWLAWTRRTEHPAWSAAAVRWLPATVVPLALYLLLRAEVLAGITPRPIAPSVNPLAGLGLLERLPGALAVHWHALLQVLAPFELRTDYSVPVLATDVGFGDARVLAGLVAALAIAVLGFRAWRRRHGLVAFAAAFWLGFAGIVSNVPITIGTVYGERLMFAPTAALALLCAWAAARPTRHLGHAGVAGLAVWCAVSATVAFRHATDFADDRTLLQREVERGGASGRVHHAWAKRLADEGLTMESGRHLAIAVERDPELARAWNDLALHWIAAGENEQARGALEVGIRARDKDDATRFALHQNLASLCVVTGDLPLARDALERLVELDEARFLDLATPLFDGYAQKISHEWLDATLAAVEQRSTHPEVWRALRGERHVRAGRFADAELLLRSALRELAPGRVRDGAELWLADALVSQGRKAEARTILERLLARDDFTPELREAAEDVLGDAR